jgi:hypothetical protein
VNNTTIVNERAQPSAAQRHFDAADDSPVATPSVSLWAPHQVCSAPPDDPYDRSLNHDGI